MSAAPWDVYRAELGDTLQLARLRAKRPCVECAQPTRSVDSRCWRCSLDDPETVREQVEEAA